MGLIDSGAIVELLGAAHRNHALIANNLANVNTPGYRTQRLRFAKELESLLDQKGGLLRGRHIETELHRPMFPNSSPDGNDVSLEREIVELNKNALRMRFYLEVLGARIRKMRAAIEGR
ncbi:MAG: flagellar basal body rod protein FlgB [Planctomycetota bacterium]|jgi:flagellar basal-body rod protein FlgB